MMLLIGFFVAVGIIMALMIGADFSERYDIDRINIGDSKDRVRSLFGEPKGIFKGTGIGGEEWEYTKPFRLYVSIKFDQSGKVAEKYSHAS